MAGEILLSELREQPRAVGRLVENNGEIAVVAAQMTKLQPRAVRIVGHGSSDNAASYGVYAFGLLPAWTAFRDSISLSIYYGADIEFRNSVVIALSQSGQTQDVVEYVEYARARGAFTVAMTNEHASELASAAEAIVPLHAGPELSIAATKTYTNQLAALYLLAAHAAGYGSRSVEELAVVCDVLERTLASSEPVAEQTAMAFAYVGRMFVVGRGVEYATAREIALKLTEVCRIAAEPLTATALAHGPVAAVDPLFPIWIVATDDAAIGAAVAAAEAARAAGATILASGSGTDALRECSYRLPTDPVPTPLLAPVVSVIPGQLFARALALAKGLDPDHPSGLRKVTLVP